MEKVIINEETLEYEVSSQNDLYTVTIGNESKKISVTKYGEEYLIFDPDKHSFISADVYKSKDKVIVWIEDEEFIIEEEKEEGFTSDEGQAENVIKAPMPGVIKEIKFKEQDKVKKGDTVIILESMKVLHELKAQIDGTIKSISVKSGAQAGPSEILVEIEPEEEK